jgi:hypothetical protein
LILTPEIAWVAGLLEGEGTFGMSDRAICISINMIDRDIIERVGALLGGRVYGPHVRGSERHKPIWRSAKRARGGRLDDDDLFMVGPSATGAGGNRTAPMADAEMRANLAEH